MRIAIYARVSTDEQAEKGSSLQTQIDALRRYAKEHNYQIHDEYVDDGYSGGTLDRPALARLRVDAQQKAFDILAVWKTDRLSRDTIDALMLVLRECRPQGIQFASITEPYDTTTPEGQMLFTNLAMFANHERTMIRIRSTQGRRRFMEMGKCVQSRLALGFARDKDKNWVHEEKGKDLYLKIVKWFLDEELSSRSIAKRLTMLGVVPRNKAMCWGNRTILNILKNPIFKGDGKYGPVRFKVPPLISEEMWDTIQARLKANTKNSGPYNNTYFWMLRGLFKCGYCGKSMVAKSSKGVTTAGNQYLHLTYQCASVVYDYYRKDQIKCPAKFHPIKKFDAESIVWNRVSKRLKNPHFMQELLAELKLTEKGGAIQLEADLLATIKALSKKAQEKDKLLTLYVKAPDIKPEDINRHINGVEDEMKELEKYKKQLEKTLSNRQALTQNLRQIEMELTTLRQHLDQLSDQERREVLKKILKAPIVIRWNEKRQRHALFSQSETTKETKQVILKFLAEANIAVQI